jgi:DNA-binding response OmpR family regulator
VLLVVGAQRSQPPTLALGIRKLGYRVRVVKGADVAQRLLARHAMPFVFMDQASLGEELPPLARALVARRRAPDGPPYLAVVARDDSLFHRLRAYLAGCAWMQVPVNGKRLAAYFEHRGLQPRRRI